MGYLKWGGKKFYPQKPKPYVASVNELIKPLSEKVNKGNVWGSVITNVYKDGAAPTPPAWTPAQMTNLNDWWRADTGLTLTGTDVDSWEGYNGQIFSPKTPALKATYSSSDSNWNNQASITINPTNSGSNAGYQVYTSGGATSRTIYGIFRINSVSNETGLFTMEDGAVSNVKRASYLVRTTETPNKLWYYTDQLVKSGAVYANSGINDGVGSYIFGAIEYNASAATKTIQFYASNTSTLGSVINTTSGTFSAADVGYLNLGFYINSLTLPAQSFSVVEVISVNGILNPTDLTELETYLNTRYGI